MSYIDRINELICGVNPDIIDFSAERQRGTAPTQVSSEFLTNKEQGDWAEKTLLEVINKNSTRYIAVKYGRDDNIIAGEDGFKEFYEDYQNELDTVGKRPDILIFDRDDYKYEDISISHFPIEELDKIVPLAKCGIEVRSSAFLINKYEEFMNNRNDMLINEALKIKRIIIDNYSDILIKKDNELYKIINLLTPENIHVISYRTPCWRTSQQLCELSSLLKELKNIITQITKRTFLSITPKVEDLKVVYNWIKRYQDPHYYVQVFFDKAYGISFEKILNLISNTELEGKEYFIEGDIKNQNKTTIKIHANKEMNVLEKVSLPEHYSEMKELGQERLLYYVKFKNSFSILNKEQWEQLFGFKII